jgi:hypothetical protein
MNEARTAVINGLKAFIIAALLAVVYLKALKNNK